MIGIVAGCKEQARYEQWLRYRQLSYTIVNSIQDVADVRVLLFCGGPDWGIKPDRDEFDKLIFTYAREKQIPMMGICRGMQEIAHLMGAELIQDLGNRNAVHRVTESNPMPMHDIILADGRRWRVNSRHHQAVASFMPDCNITAKSEDGVLEMIVSDKERIWLVQCHPERDEMRDSEMERACVERLKLKINPQ
jgi:putative glutamine amidotransferase